MTKRRTKKKKRDAKHQFIVNVEKLAESGSNQTVVKGENKFSLKKGKTKPNASKNAKLLAKDENLASIKKDILKSLGLALFILGTELMIYLFR